MPVERTELTAGGVSFTAELELPEGGGDHGAVLLPGANHTAFDDAVFDRLAAAAAEAGVEFLRYETWADGEELADKPGEEIRAEVDAALDHLHERGCARVSLVGKSAGGAIALRHPPDRADDMILWAPAIFLDDGEVLPTLDVPEGADPRTISAAELAAVEGPVELLQGDEDAIPVANARELAAALSDATVHVVEGADHSFVGGDPETEAVERTVGALSRSPDA